MTPCRSVVADLLDLGAQAVLDRSRGAAAAGRRAPRPRPAGTPLVLRRRLVRRSRRGRAAPPVGDLVGPRLDIGRRPRESPPRPARRRRTGAPPAPRCRGSTLRGAIGTARGRPVGRPLCLLGRGFDRAYGGSTRSGQAPLG